MASSRFNQAARFWDRFARHIITTGGILIILSVVGILFMIARVALPRFHSAPPRPLGAPRALAASGQALAVGSDEYAGTVHLVTPGGQVSVLGLREGALLAELRLAAPQTTSTATIVQATAEGPQYSLLWSDGALTLDAVRVARKLGEDGHETFTARLERLAWFEPESEGVPAQSLARGGNGRFTRVSLLADGRLKLTRQAQKKDVMGRVRGREAQTAMIREALPAAVTALALDAAGTRLAAGTARGELLRWSLEDFAQPRLLDQLAAFPDQRGITALAPVLGDVSLAVGDARGGVTTWAPVRTAERGNAESLRKIHDVAQHAAPIRRLVASRKSKSILSLDAQGVLRFTNMTSGRELLALAGGPEALRLAGLAQRDNALVGVGVDGALRAWALEVPHPEVSLRTLFGKVWYEGYPAPAHVWQSSSASDDFEPKLSLVPLIYGTLKATFYALLFAVPLAIFGALYTSQFMRPSVRALVKPAIEVMAAIPSVVIGFLAALWLAPRIEDNTISMFLAVIVLPGVLLLSIFVWQRLARRPRFARASFGNEFLLIIPFIILGVLLAAWAGPWLEAHFFGKSFPQWFFNTTGERYDQRNSIIIALALGFAIIPIIFTIADDSMSNIPRSLTAASLALGASRWQTAWRIVLPSASPGIFAGVMIGFGRAVGETMIVLMATGNTPIIDWSPFNGMRTLSANIAVEIPEAPVDGTLYRVLFLTAVLLFFMTFIVNTAAELVRQRLRRKYGQL